MTKSMAVLAEWFEERPEWMIKAANRLLEKGDLENQDIIDLAELCKKEAVGELDDAEPIMSGHAFGVTGTLVEYANQSMTFRC